MPKSMFTIGTLGVGALVVVAVIPAFAGASRATPTVADERSVGPPTHEFEALSSLPDARRVGLTVMSEEELAAVEGAVFPCVVCVNAAKIREALVANLRQTLVARIHQRLIATIRPTHPTTVRQTHVTTIRQTNARHSSVDTHQRNSVRVVQRN